MKAFVYDKKTNETLLVVNAVTNVEERGKLIVISTNNECYAYKMKEVKTRIYQN